jgi:hypothetical protein
MKFHPKSCADLAQKSRGVRNICARENVAVATPVGGSARNLPDHRLGWTGSGDE